LRKEELSGRQLACITALFIIGSSSVIGNSGIAKKDTWIAVLAAIAIAVPLILIYGRISALFQERNLFDIIYRVFGKRLGWVITLLTSLYCFHLGALVLRDFPEFIQAVSFQKTPKIIFAMLLGLLCAYLAKLGVRTFGKAGILFSALVGVVAVLTFLLLLPSMNVHNLQPVLAMPPGVIAQNAAKLFSTPFGETVLLLCLFCNMKSGQSRPKAYLTGLLLGGLYLVMSVLRNILALGAGNFSSLYFPSYSVVSTINIGDFLQRLEVLVSSYMLLCDITKIAVALYATCLGVAKLAGIDDYRKIVLPVSWLMIALSLAAFQNTMEFFSWPPLYYIYALPFQVGLPVILWIWAEVNKSKLFPKT